MKLAHVVRPALSMLAALTLVGAVDADLAPVRPVTDTYDGVAVVDPYRYMEDGDPASLAWRTAQLAATSDLLARARSSMQNDGVAARPASPRRLTDLAVAHGHAFFVRLSPPGITALVERDIAGGPERTIVASTRYDRPNAPASLGAFAVSNDATKIQLHVYLGDASDSDIHIIRVADGADVEPPLHHTIYDYCGFTPDDRAVVYAKAPGTKLRGVPAVSYDYLHRIGGDPRRDAIIFGTKVSPLVDVPPHAFAFVDTTSNVALAEVRDVAAGGSRFYAAPLATVGRPHTPWRPLGTAADGYTDYAQHGTTIDLVTKAGAPNYRVVRASLTGPFVPHDIVPASERVVVSGTLDGIPKAGIFALYAASDADYVQLLDRGVARMVRVPWNAGARPQRVPLPLDGSILQVATDLNAPGALLDVTNWTTAGDVYAFDPASGSMHATGLVPSNDDPPRVAEELTATSADGTPVGVTVVHRPGIALDGSHPTLLRVAGAYGFSITPDYRSAPDVWLDRGGVYAVAHVRGGGELGEAWHHAAMGAKKAASWLDLIAAAKVLIADGYTSPKRLDLYGTTQSYLGGVASSIVIGRAIEERPDLFAAAVVDAPSFDMLRSERTAMGVQSVSEFGSVSTRDGFAALLAMSPYEHVQPGVRYPTVLARAFSNIGFGSEWQASKMVARLQAAAGSADAAYLETPFGPGDNRTQTALNNDAYAFFLYENATVR